MNDAPDQTRDWRDTVFLPKTDFPMKAGLPQKEPAILAKWQQAGLYERLRDARRGREKFILHDGPPYANGDMHIGHALNHILKDMVCRTQNLLGKDAPYVPGWDCHGLPIEWKVEEEYRKKKKNKDEVPADEFRAECRAYAQKWVDTQREQLKRLGILGDWDHPYLTMDYAAEATIVAELMKFAESGQLYRGAKPVMWSPVEKTALAEAEVEYEDIVSTQIDVAFEIVEAPNAPELVGAHAVVWTTTPWTIPVNQALAYGPEVEYSILQIADGELNPTGEMSRVNVRRYLVASELLEQFYARTGWHPEEGHIVNDEVPFADMFMELSGVVDGTKLAGAKARHPLAKFFDRHPGESRGPASSGAGEGSGTPDQVRGDAGSGESAGLNYDPASPLAEFFLRPRPFLPGDFVTTDQGTGLVHMAPDHGEDDFDLCKAHGIEPVFAVEGDGKYRADWAWLGGQGSVINPKFNAPDGPICADLQAAGALLAASADYKHSYPHSWRSKAKLIFRCTPQWFVPMDRALPGTVPAPQPPADVALPLVAVPLAPDLAGAQLVVPGGAGTSVQFNRALDYLVLNVGGTRHIVCEPLAPAYLKRIGAAFDLVELVKGALFEGATAQRGDDVLPLCHDDDVSRAAGTGFAMAGGADTLRTRALGAIDATRFYPEKGRNRIRAMVEGRPDWVLSRQRAWGVPITLFVDRKTGQYLADPEVNARIVAAVREGGVDAWCDAHAQDYLGNRYAADYERVTDILDVWFDSGCTHAFVLESGRWADLTWPADLYLEGSDQHRGWFQSSLLESCGTRGRAPYKAVLTHGFTMDAKGLKMSKSLGNTVNPLDLMKDYGADILRLWALSVDFTEDHRIGKEILAGVADQYRKLRNTFRYLLGALEGFDEDERVAVAEMPELERYMLALLAEMDAKLKAAAESFDFNSYTRLLCDFANNDLSAFFFDIRKDSLYCDAATSLKRRSYRTVLDMLFHALVRYAAPVLVYTAEEVWGTRYPEGESVHLLEWPVLPEVADGHDLGAADDLQHIWARLRELRRQVTEAIEPLRRDKLLGSSLEAEIVIPPQPDQADFAELFISGTVHMGDTLAVTKTTHHKCGRCWRHLPEVAEDGELCGRCAEVVA
ncbi:isoleucine--tRNA ligase [Sphingomonas sp.]|uniref:isoleucine--tRNA ligase n=1 Tax=Sphingomonas sp. TaxID=28214 RepID=UPI001D90D706|nr:isoleucine--tRNA ligase [Sphingomonas sp.]MBX9796625.1 isoleucine--tRNA ligase [Sphingomonas sp.]